MFRALETAAEVRDEAVFNFECDDLVPTIEQRRSELARPGANLADKAAIGDSDGRCNLIEHHLIAEEMLTEGFPRCGIGGWATGHRPMVVAGLELSRGCRSR